jgi:hypothetical protein
MKVPKALGRIDELDLLRGFFILVILIDHFQRWPSPFTYISGEGRLWVSAAEGFFIISGLLIGYLRGYKQKNVPLRELSKKLAARAGMLYIWAVGITFFVVAMTVILPVDPNLLPRVADVEQTVSLGTYVANVLTMNFASDWIYFLRLYAIMLLATPLVIWMFRKGWWIAVLGLSSAIYGISFLSEVPEGAMQWQFLFFVASVMGFKLEEIAHWFRERPKIKKAFIYSTVTLAFATMILSYFWVLGWKYVEAPGSSFSRDTYVATRSWLDPWFAKAPLAIGRVLLSFVWFAGLLSLFHHFLPYIQRWFGWLLRTFGTQSLSAYCLQAMVFVFVQYAIPVTTNWYVNALTTTAVILLMWSLLRIPAFQKILPR